MDTQKKLQKPRRRKRGETTKSSLPCSGGGRGLGYLYRKARSRAERSKEFLLPVSLFPEGGKGKQKGKGIWGIWVPQSSAISCSARARSHPAAAEGSVGLGTE